MSRPLLVVIQGAPGSGKTTLLNKLKQDISLPMLGKDEIKEFLFDTLPQSDRDFSTIQGKAAIAMLYSFAETFLKNGQSVLVESAFHTEFARADVGTVLASTNARLLEFHCHTDEDVRIERFKQRVRSGARHPGHQDQNAIAFNDAEKYSALKITESSFDIDMTAPLAGERYDEIVSKIRSFLKEDGV